LEIAAYQKAAGFRARVQDEVIFNIVLDSKLPNNLSLSLVY